MNHKLGRLPVRHDQRTLKLSTYLKTPPPVPSAVDWGGGVPLWGMLANDTVGDCTCAGAGHADMLWTANASTEISVTDQQVLAAYSAITGYNPADPNTDQGANMLDVLNYWRQTGIAGVQINSYVSVDWTNPDEVAAAIYLFGSLYIGVNLPQSAEDTFVTGLWSDTTDTNIVGGHCVLLTGYDQKAQTVKVVTWGQEITATLAWIKTYCEEAYAVLALAWMEEVGQAPNGIDYVQLQADLTQVQSQ